MKYVLDLVLVAIIALCAWNGYRKGFILGVSGILALIVAFYGAHLLADTYSQEFTTLLEPFVSGIVDSTVESQTMEENVSEEELDAYDITYASMGKLGIMKSAADNLAEEIEERVKETGQQLRATLVETLCSKLAYVATAVIAFLLIIIIITVIANVLNLAFKLPGLEVINYVFGILFGLAKGLIFAFAIAWVLRYTGFIFKQETIDETILLKWLMEHNLLAHFFGF